MDELVLNRFINMPLKGYEAIPMHDTVLQEFAHRVAQVDAEASVHQINAEQLEKDSKDMLAMIAQDFEKASNPDEEPSNVVLERRARASKRWRDYMIQVWEAKKLAAKWSVVALNMHSLQDALRSEYSKWGKSFVK